MTQTKTKLFFGEFLVEKKIITKEDLEACLNHQKNTRKKLGQIIVESGFVSSAEMLEVLSDFLEVPLMRLNDQEFDPPRNESLTLKFLKQYKVFPAELNGDDQVLKLVMADPRDYYTIDTIKLLLDCDVDVYLGNENEIVQMVENYYGSGASTLQTIIDDMTEEDLEILAMEEDEDVDQLRDMASEAPVIKLVNLFISQAVEKRASDIHIEPFEGQLKVRYRIDGVLHDVESPPRRLQAAIISRVKIMAGLNIAERRLPQDGRIRLRVLGKKLDLRVSCIPTMHGESVVMRILDQSSILMDLRELGFQDKDFFMFEQIIKRPHGIVLVTGPTGSGKTTTLYGALDKINNVEKKIITVEDPVEYQLKGVNQIQVNPKIGLTFAYGLRSIVRQDPDIIMVGEIRDRETGEIAIQSALTGHLVFSTLHTNDAPGAITRLVDMGLENYLVASCLESVMAQRLVRIICPHCKREVDPDVSQLRDCNFLDECENGLKVYEGEGCKECGNTGYLGRTGIYELLVVNDPIRELILQKVSANIVRKEARRQGMRTLREDGWSKVKNGITTVEEVLRVTQDEEVVLEK